MGRYVVVGTCQPLLFEIF